VEVFVEYSKRVFSLEISPFILVQPMQKKEVPLIKLDQAALDIIVAQHKLYRENRPGGKRAVLVRHDLSGLVLCGCDLAYADFSGSVFYEADLEFANLEGSVFFGCDLRKANFRNAKMQRVDLRGAALRGAIMSNADLTNADLREGSFAVYDQSKGLSFSGDQAAWLEGVGNVDLRGANMGSVKLSGAVAINSNFEDANLSSAKVIRANLTGSNLAGANLSNADLSNCQLRDINMRGANLVGTLMDYSNLVNVDMTGTLTDKPAGKTLDQLPMPLDQMLVQHALWLETIGAEGQRLDIGGFDMRGTSAMNKANLAMLLADHSVWYGQDLAGINMQAAHFTFADLRSCVFDNADLRGSNFSKANLVGSKMRNVRLEPLLLNDKRLLKTSFAGANLRYTDFTGAVLRDVNFDGADLSFADFTGAEIKESAFHDVVMEETKIDSKNVSRNYIIIKERERNNQ
jgi:uncharacterized protein YjbI with pentapeptide repeats